MVQVFNKTNHQGRMAEMLGMSLGQGLGQGINTYYANKAIDDVVNDPSTANQPISAKMGKLQSALAPYGEQGQNLFKQRMMIEEQAYNEKQEAKLEKEQALRNKQGAVVGKILNKQPVTDEERAILSAEQSLAIAKHEQAIELQGLKNAGKAEKAPLGGLAGTPITQEESQAMREVLEENPNATAEELELALGERNVRPGRFKGIIESRRRGEETKAKNESEQQKALRSETLPLRTQIAEKALTAQHGINNKKHLMDIIDRGDVDDPTFAIVADLLPFNLGKRLLSNDTLEVKAGLVDEFGDLKNLFQGATRVKELDILQEKIADVYLTDSQKKAILKSRINALQYDVIMGEAAAELEEEGKNYPVSIYQKKILEKAKSKLDNLFNRILDEQKFIIQDAENRKKMPLNINDPEDKEIIQQIYKESGNNWQRATELAKKKGYHW